MNDPPPLVSDGELPFTFPAALVQAAPHDPAKAYVSVGKGQGCLLEAVFTGGTTRLVRPKSGEGLPLSFPLFQSSSDELPVLELPRRAKTAALRQSNLCATRK